MNEIIDFITETKDGTITGYHSGNIDANFTNTPYNGQKRTKVPSGSNITAGDKSTYYGKNWNRKPDILLMQEGLMPIPAGFLLEDNILREMTQIERINAGLEQLPIGQKIVSGELVHMTQVERIEAGIDELPLGMKIEEGRLASMTDEEKLNTGVLTQEEYNNQLKIKNIAELQRLLAELQTPEVLAEAEIDEGFAAERRIKLTAIIAVKKQPGWPLEAEWPE